MKVLIIIIALLSLSGTPQAIFITQNGQVEFSSDAPLELIKASSNKLKSVLDTEKNTFAFLVPLNSFEGFNDPLQKDHFCEKFLICDRFPQASFTGKIIEEVPFDQPGSYEIRAKGEFSIHGISQERIIKAKLLVEKGGLHIKSTFTVKLVDHKIKVPKIVYNKIAEEIYVEISASLQVKTP